MTRHEVGTRNWRAVCWRCEKDFGSLSRFFSLRGAEGLHDVYTEEVYYVVKKSLAALLAITAALLLIRAYRAHDAIKREDKAEVLFGDAAEKAAMNLAPPEDPALIQARERLLEKVVSAIPWSYHIEKDINEGTACWYCKGPHPYSWCPENPKAKTLEALLTGP